MEQKHITNTADSPDTDGETPLHSHVIKPFSSFPSNKNPSYIAYKECLKNHAATIGSHALDGCGEFMPSLTATPHEPTSLKCAACGCHRNFHRREHINDVYAYAPHLLSPFNSNDHTHTHTQLVVRPNTPNGRKRFRTKFSQQQKDKMFLFAEKVGWKMQRCDDKLVNDFCNEVGIKRGIFKVWMHNNKNTFGRKDKETNSPSVVSADTGTGTDVIVSAGVADKTIDIYNNGRVVDVNGGDNMSDNSDQENCGGGDVHMHVSNNGSSSSC